MDGQGSKAHGVNKLENRGVCPDAQPERQNRDERKGRALPELPYTVTEILRKQFEPSHSVLLSLVVTLTWKYGSCINKLN